MISIIVPIYNAERYLHRCIDSILAQTFQDFELILVDDGSTDNSGAICDKYANLDKRVKVFHKGNGGVSSARNFGLNYADGDYLMFFDSDDYMKPEMCEILYHNIISKKTDLVICGTEETGGEIWQPWGEIDFDLQSFILEYVSFPRPALIAPPWNKIYKKELLKSGFNESTSFGEDLIFNLQYIKNCNRISFIMDYPMFHTKNNPLSLSSVVYPKRLKEIELCFQSIIEFCTGIHKASDLSVKYFNDIATYARMLLKNSHIDYEQLSNEFNIWHKDAYIKVLWPRSTRICLKDKALLYCLKYKLWKIASLLVNRRLSQIS